MRILITGNGFDLNEDLPTKYADFITIINHLKNDGQLDYHSIFSKLKSYDQICERYNPIKIDERLLTEIMTLSSKNDLLKFFNSEYEIDTWIDFENKLEYLLAIICDCNKIINKNIFSKKLQRELQNYQYEDFDYRITIPEVMANLGFFKKINMQFSIEHEYLVDRYDTYLSLDLQKIFRKIEVDFQSFTQIFNLYLQAFVFPFYKQRKSRPADKFSKIDKHYTFNYTPTFTQFYNPTMVTHFLHGESGLNYNNIVMGINDISEGMDPALMKFTKYYQKYSKKTHHHFLNGLTGAEKRQPFEFYFWGHSLDSSDADYINEVFDFLTENVAAKSRIIIIYHSELSYQQLLLNLFFIRGKKDIQNKMGRNKLVFVYALAEELTTMLQSDLSFPNKIRS